MPNIHLRVTVDEDADLTRMKDVLIEDLLQEEHVEDAIVLGYQAKVVAVSSGDDQRLYGPFESNEDASDAADDVEEGAIVIALHSPDALIL